MFQKKLVCEQAV